MKYIERDEIKLQFFLIFELSHYRPTKSSIISDPSLTEPRYFTIHMARDRHDESSFFSSRNIFPDNLSVQKQF